MSYSYRIEQAIRAASVLHKDQVRKGAVPLPYVTHLFAVAMITADYTDDEDTIIAAFLHDTIEDTDYTPEELQDDFGGTVKELVLTVTQPESEATDRESWKAVKKQYLKQLKSGKEGALIVAAADKIHNMRSAVEEYYDRHSEFLADFGGSLEDRLLMYQEASNIFNRNLKNDILSEFNHVFNEYKQFIHDVQESTKNQYSN